MEQLTKSLHTHLVSLAYGTGSHEAEHRMEHLLTLLPTADADALTAYYGLFGQPRLSLQELATGWGLTQEEALARVNRLLRRIAVSPEWEQMRQQGR